MIEKLPEMYWKKMRFCILSIIPVLARYEDTCKQCAVILRQIQNYNHVIKNIPFVEWKIGFHYQIKCQESGKANVGDKFLKSISKKDYVKLRFLYMQLLFLIRTCSEKSFEKAYAPYIELTEIREKLLKMLDEMSGGVKIINSLPYQDNGVNYTYSIETVSGIKPDWPGN